MPLPVRQGADMNTIAGHPYWELSFTKDGGLTAPDSGEFAAAVAASGVADLFMMSHGWGASAQAAHELYEAMFPLVAEAAPQAHEVGPIGFAGIFWPSLWFPDPPQEATPRVAEAVQAGRPGAANAALSGPQIADALKESFDDPEEQANLEQMGRLIEEGIEGVGSEPRSTQEDRLARFHGLLQTLVRDDQQPREDSGETALLRTGNPERDYATISEAVGSTRFDPAAEGIGDIFGKIWNGAKDALRMASYYEMKARAGDIGHNGLGPLLERLHARQPVLRVHLIGHSFGARLVSFALSGITSAQASPVASLYLIQGAFSHWSFAGLEGMPFGTAGALSEYADRVHGPLVATFSEHDWAVGHWYPRASFLARQDAEDAASQWGGMGFDGFQGVSPVGLGDLLPVGTAYALTPGSYYRVNGSTIIADTLQSPFSGAHSDIRHPEVAWLAVAAAAARDSHETRSPAARGAQ
jgi:hypothetical protein